MRIGHGYDAHRFGEGRRLVLGGVEVPYQLGMVAHSDGDVVIHALCDALLGAAGLGDIGKHFPDTDQNYENIDSRLLLRHVVQLLHDNHFTIGNADITIVAQAPKLASHIPLMHERLAVDCVIDVTRMNIKATTTEKMGFTGRGEGIACYAVALLNEPGA